MSSWRIVAVLGVLLLAPGSAFSAVSFYSDSYQDAFRPRTIQFQRLRYERTMGTVLERDWLLYGAGLRELYDERNLFSVEAGAEYIVSKSWRLQAAGRWLNFNQDESKDIQVRAGILGGHFTELGVPWLIFEDFVEGFLLVPGRSKAQFAGDGSVRVSYRAYAKNHWILDPAFVELRGYRASNPEYGGRGYLATNVGPHASYWWQDVLEGSGSISLFLARNLVWGRGEKAKGGYWFLLTVGASF